MRLKPSRNLTPPIEQKRDEVIVFGVSIGGILLGAIFAWFIMHGVTKGSTGIAGRLAAESAKARDSASRFRACRNLGCGRIKGRSGRRPIAGRQARLERPLFALASGAGSDRAFGG